MKSFAEKYKEYLATDSKLSSMRLAFFWVVRSALLIAFVSVVFNFVAGIMSKQFDLAAASAMVGLLLATAFGGKMGQSFAEKDQQ